LYEGTLKRYKVFLKKLIVAQLVVKLHNFHEKRIHQEPVIGPYKFSLLHLCLPGLLTEMLYTFLTSRMRTP
jgi:hypothetical protein